MFFFTFNFLYKQDAIKPIKIIKAEWDSPDNYVCSKIIPAKYNKEKLEILMQPFQDKSFFIISDTITNDSGWIEGALSSSEKSLTKIISIIKKMQINFD